MNPGVSRAKDKMTAMPPSAPAKKVRRNRYDRTAGERVQRERDAVISAGGARVETLLDQDELERLDALVKSGEVRSRRAGLKYAVRQLPPPGRKKRG